MKSIIALVASLSLASAPIAWAGPGHDHGDEPAAAAGSTSPRVTAHSELFEVVGIVDGRTLTIYLDRYSDNAPVNGAKIEVEAGSAKGMAVEQPDGTYTFSADLLLKEGSLPVTLAVSAGKDTDLLAGDLVIGHAQADTNAAPAAATWRTNKLVWAGAAASVVVLAGAAFLWRRHSRRSAAVGPAPFQA